MQASAHICFMNTAAVFHTIHSADYYTVHKAQCVLSGSSACI